MIEDCTLSLDEFQKRFECSYLNGYAFSRKEHCLYMLVDMNERDPKGNADSALVELCFEGVASCRSNRYKHVKVCDRIKSMEIHDDGTVILDCNADRLDEIFFFCPAEEMEELFPDAPESSAYEIKFKCTLKRVSISVEEQY